MCRKASYYRWLQGCQMVCFQTINPNLGKFWRVLLWTMMVYFIDTWSILQSFILVYGQWVQFVVIWYIFPRFGILYQEKSGNPGWLCCSSGSIDCEVIYYRILYFKWPPWRKYQYIFQVSPNMVTLTAAFVVNVL
jgi:hypothetical protein